MQINMKNVFHGIAEIKIINMRYGNGLGMETRNK
jgi:hypothetical protein